MRLLRLPAAGRLQKLPAKPVFRQICLLPMQKGSMKSVPAGVPSGQKRAIKKPGYISITGFVNLMFRTKRCSVRLC